MKTIMGKWKARRPTIALFVFSFACATTFSEVSAQNATFTTRQYPLLGNTHIAADLNGTANSISPVAVRMRCRCSATLTINPGAPSHANSDFEVIQRR